MKYTAKKIYLSCDRKKVREWAAYMQAHVDEVVQSLVQEGVRHEAWYMGEDDGGLYIVGVMDVDDQAASSAITQHSSLSVDTMHRQFKLHWDRSRITDLHVAPGQAPALKGCELLLDARRNF